MPKDLQLFKPETAGVSPAGPDSSPAELVRMEAAALHQLADRLDGPLREPFASLADHVVRSVKDRCRIALTGVGKSGLIARKIAATFVSLGTPAIFLHATDALHGDLGLLARGDMLLALSYSGETEEVLRILPALQALGVTLASFCGCPGSTLACASAHVLDVGVEREACAHQLAPTASTTAMLALGDALAIAVSRKLEFEPRDFAALHPGGQLGRRFATVRQLMHSGAELPQVAPAAAMPEIIHEMSAKRLGITVVATDGSLLGVLSDGDLRRLLERSGPDAFSQTAAQVMNPHPRTVAPEAFAADALALMEKHKVTALPVTEDGTAGSPLLGVLHLHDLWEFAPGAGVRPNGRGDTSPRSPS